METPALTIHHYRQKLLLWFLSHCAREQVLLIILAATLLICLLYSGIWAPAEEKLHEMQTLYLKERALSKWLDDNAPLAQQRAANAPNTNDNTPLSIIITDTAKKEGLAIKRLELTKDEARITCENIPFNTLITWLNTLANTYHVKLLSLAVTSTNTQGYVNTIIKIK